MTIRHHLSDPLLMAYSAGQLPEAFSLVVATHVSLCDDCRSRLMAFDTIGGALIEDAAEARMADDSLEATLARISGGPQAEPARATRSLGGVFPAPLREPLSSKASSRKKTQRGPSGRREWSARLWAPCERPSHSDFLGGAAKGLIASAWHRLRTFRGAGGNRAFPRARVEPGQPLPAPEFAARHFPRFPPRSIVPTRPSSLVARGVALFLSHQTAWKSPL